MKKLLCLSFLLISFFISAQELDFEWGADIKFAQNTASPEIIGLSDELIYILGSDNPKHLDDFYIGTFDRNTFNQKNRFLLKPLLPKEMADNDLEEVFMIEDKIVIISSNKTEVVGSILDLEGKMVKARINLLQIEKEKNENGYIITLASDRSKLMITRKIEPKKKENVSYQFLIYDNQLKKISQFKQLMSYNSEHFTFKNAILTNNGDVYFSGTILVDGPKRKFDTYKSGFYFLSTASTKPELTDINFSTDGKILSSVNFSIGENEIRLTGLYTDNKNSEFMQGIFQLTLDKSTYAVLSKNYEPFIKGLFSREGTSDKLIPGVNSGYDIEHIINGSNGEKYLVLHNSFSYFRSDERGTDKYLLSLDIIVVKLDANNKIIWNVMVNKNQTMRIPYYVNMSAYVVTIPVPVYRKFKKYEDLLDYSMLIKGNDLVFIYNDHIENLKTKGNPKAFNSLKKSYCAEVKLDLTTGKQTKKSVFKSTEEETLMLPKNYLQIAEDAIITFAIKGERSYAMGKITLSK